MKHALALVIASFLAFPASAESAAAPETVPLFQDGTTADLNEFRWKYRPLVIMADSPADPRFIQQLDLLHDQEAPLRDRDVIILTDTDPAAKSALRQKLRPRGFMLVLIGKDGTVYLRKPFPWNVREISRSIDKLPLRQQEVRDRRATTSE